MLEEEQTKAAGLLDTVNKQDLDISKNKMEWQFKEEKSIKELTYAKEKYSNLESVKVDLESQLAAATTSISNLKLSEKSLNERIQKLEMEGIKSRETVEKIKKDIKILE